MSTLVCGMCSVCCHMALVFMHYIVFFICDCFCPFFFITDTDMPDRNGQCYQYQHLLTLFAMLYESNTEGTNFRSMFICFSFVFCSRPDMTFAVDWALSNNYLSILCFVLYSTCVSEKP